MAGHSRQAKTRRGRDGLGRLWMILVGCAVCTTSLIVWNVTSNTFVLNQQPQLSSRLTSTYHSLQEESMASLRARLPPCVWSRAGSNSNAEVAKLVKAQLTTEEKEKATQLCGKFLYSSIIKAVRVGDMGEQTFVSTGDIDDMWTRDSAVQMSLYVSRMKQEPFLRPIIEGAIRRQAFNIIQDPYANAYERTWQDPAILPFRDTVIGRGGWVATRNYELDSGAYFCSQLYDYYVAQDLYKPELLLAEPLIFDAVMLMVNTWIVEQHHDTQSPYRYFELSNDGKGPPTAYTGMTWTGFRPSDDPAKHGYLVPANIFAAGSLERMLVLNQRIWHSEELHEKATKLLLDIEDGIRQHGVVKTNDTEGLIYAYEVDGMGNTLADFDDANIPSLLSIPLLGWSGYNKQVYKATRDRLLSTKNPYYFSGQVLHGLGSPHTGLANVWPLALAIQALTQDGTAEQLADTYVFQLRQSLTSACKDAMHESVNVHKGCNVSYTRPWFEWSNAMFVVLVESSLGIRCDASGLQQARVTIAERANRKQGNTTTLRYYNNKFNNNHTQSDFFQGIEAMVPHDVTISTKKQQMPKLK